MQKNPNKRKYILVLWLIAGLLSPHFLITKTFAKDNTVTTKETQGECVILLHGLARTSKSMIKMERALSESGYTVFNVDYPSRKYPVELLSSEIIPPAIDSCRASQTNKIHFVTHSMGGILIRHYLSGKDISELGKIVMLSPPNQGSEVVDKLKSTPGFTLLNGPAGHQLGTDDASITSQLGPADFELGIITGNRTINFFLSTLIPGADDGKVSVARAKLEGMDDFLIVPYSHPFIMKRKAVIEQTIFFLQQGKFK